MSDVVRPDNALVLQWIFGAMVVTMYAWDRFKNPPLTRSTTTFGRYWLAALGYCVAMQALFVFLGGGITSFNLKAVEPLVGEFPKGVAALPGPLLSALLLTSLLPHFPVLAKIDESLKRWFWRVGNIPIEVRVLSARLEEALYRPPEHARESFPTFFSAYSADPQWLAEPAGSLKLRWANCVALFGQVQRWEDARAYARYVEQNKAALSGIRLRVSELAQLLNEQTLTELDRNSHSLLVVHLRKKVEADMTSLRRALCDFVAGGILNESWNDKQRHAALTQLGFTGLPQQRNPLSSHDIVLVTGLVFIAILFVPLMMHRFIDPHVLPTKARILVMVPIVYAIAIVAAIYPKAAWPFASRVPGGARPVAAYALSGVVAAVAAFLVSVLFRFAFDTQGNVFQALATPGAFGKAFRVSFERWPWLLMTFSATVAIAWTADDYQPGGALAPKWLRWAESAALAAIFGTAQWTVAQLLIANLPQPIADEMAAAKSGMVVTASVIGACIGFLVPSLYRSNGPKKDAQESVPGPALERPSTAPP